MPTGMKYGGRVKGTPNKATIEKRQIVDQYLEKLGADRFLGDGVDFLKFCYQNQMLPIHVRLDAAKAAAPYERAKPNGNEGVEPVRIVIDDLRPKLGPSDLLITSTPDTVMEAVLVEKKEAAD